MAKLQNADKKVDQQESSVGTQNTKDHREVSTIERKESYSEPNQTKSEQPKVEQANQAISHQKQTQRGLSEWERIIFAGGRGKGGGGWDVEGDTFEVKLIEGGINIAKKGIIWLKERIHNAQKEHPNSH